MKKFNEWLSANVERVENVEVEMDAIFDELNVEIQNSIEDVLFVSNKTCGNCWWGCKREPIQ